MGCSQSVATHDTNETKQEKTTLEPVVQNETEGDIKAPLQANIKVSSIVEKNALLNVSINQQPSSQGRGEITEGKSNTSRIGQNSTDGIVTIPEDYDSKNPLTEYPLNNAVENKFHHKPNSVLSNLVEKSMVPVSQVLTPEEESEHPYIQTHVSTTTQIAPLRLQGDESKRDVNEARLASNIIESTTSCKFPSNSPEKNSEMAPFPVQNPTQSPGKSSEQFKENQKIIQKHLKQGSRFPSSSDIEEISYVSTFSLENPDSPVSSSTKSHVIGVNSNIVNQEVQNTSNTLDLLDIDSPNVIKQYAARHSKGSESLDSITMLSSKTKSSQFKGLPPSFESKNNTDISITNYVSSDVEDEHRNDTVNRRRQSQQLYNDETSIIPLRQLKNLSSSNNGNSEGSNFSTTDSMKENQPSQISLRDNVHISNSLNQSNEITEGIRTSSPIVDQASVLIESCPTSDSLNLESASTPALKNGKYLFQHESKSKERNDFVLDTSNGPITTQSTTIKFHPSNRAPVSLNHPRGHSFNDIDINEKSRRSPIPESWNKKEISSSDATNTPNSPSVTEDCKLSRSSSHNKITDSSNDISSSRSTFSECDDRPPRGMNKSGRNFSTMKSIDPAFEINSTEIVSYDLINYESISLEELTQQLKKTDPVCRLWENGTMEKQIYSQQSMVVPKVDVERRLNETFSDIPQHGSLNENENLVWMSNQTKSLVDQITRYSYDSEPDSARASYERTHELSFDKEEYAFAEDFSPLKSQIDVRFSYSNEDGVLMGMSDDDNSEEDIMEGFRETSDDDSFGIDDNLSTGEDADFLNF